MNNASPKKVLRYRRLTFVRDVIDRLQPDDIFRMETALGVFEMTKKDFLETFPGVVRSAAYRVGGRFSYPKTPRRMERFRVGAAPDPAITEDSPKEYALPDELKGECSEAAYRKWLQRKAAAHVRRDSMRWKKLLSISKYKKAIHAAVCRTTKYDAYTGEALDWSLISKYRNEPSRAGGRTYKRELAMLPTVDHVGDTPGDMNFQICSWRTNSAKSDLSLEEFVDLCRKAVRHYDRAQAGILPITLDPPQVDEFKRRLLESRAATIAIHYENGSSRTRQWDASRFTVTSDVIGNLRSKPDFRHGEWQKLRIARIHVSIFGSPQVPLGVG